MRPARSISVLLVVFCCGFLASAQDITRGVELVQETRDTLSKMNNASILFERNINTFNWLGQAAVDTTVGDVGIRLRERYTSAVTFLDGGSGGGPRNLQSNQQNLSLQLRRPLTPDLITHTRWSSLVYSDNKSLGLSTASIHSLLGGVQYLPAGFVSLTPLVGYRWDNQAGFRDKGLSYLIGAQTHELRTDGYALTAEAQFREDRLDPRTLQTHFATAGVQKTFEGGSRDSLELGFRQNRREFYVIADSNIESRSDQLFTFTNLLDYELDRGIVTTLFVNVASRLLDKDVRYKRSRPDGVFDTQIEEFRLDTYIEASYRPTDGGLSASARMYYSERNESHTAKPIPDAPQNIQDLFRASNQNEKLKDNLSRRTALSGTVRIPMSLSDTVTGSGAASILRYDTPADSNFQDRDELLLALSLSTSHHISQYLDVGVSLEGNLSHIVYLFSKQSANNNYNRVLRLSPRVTYRPTREVTTMNIFEVLANYTVYDFEQQLALVRSFSYRQFSWIDSTSVEFTHKVGLDFFAYLKLYERGQLKWSEFSERTENSFVDRTFAAQVRFAPYTGLLFAVGMRYFSQSRYVFDADGKTLDSFLRSIGPTCAITWESGRYSSISLRGWYERQTQTRPSGVTDEGTARSLTNISMNIIINF